MITPKGPGEAIFVIDYSPEFHLFFTVALDKGGELWTFKNSQLRLHANETLGRTAKTDDHDEHMRLHIKAMQDAAMESEMHSGDALRYSRGPKPEPEPMRFAFKKNKWIEADDELFNKEFRRTHERRTSIKRNRSKSRKGNRRT